ncbi:MAG: molybdate ABC transporter substrate-binding protein [Aminipila sp.]
MRKTKIFLLIGLVMVMFISCGQSNKEQKLNISAAASLTDALTEIGQEYNKENDVELLFNFAGSGTLKTQISEGADCDIFISASKDHMDELEKNGIIQVDSRKNLLGNTLTLIASKEAEETVALDNLDSELNSKEVGSISIGTPDSVPAGKYAVQAFENMGIYDEVESKLIFAKDVRGVLDYVETGNVDCGIVYKTDALLLKSGKVICDIPMDKYDPIIYPMAMIKDAKNQQAAKDFVKFLQSDEALRIFEKYGFVTL